MKAPLPTQEMMLKYWKTVQEIHGPLPADFSSNFQPSKEHAQRFFLNIPNSWFSEVEARRNIETDREGALSLFLVTLWQACLDEWAVRDKETLSAAKTPEIKMEQEQFQRVGALGFCADAIRKYPVFSRKP